MIDMPDLASAGAMFHGVWADMQQPGFWVSVLQIIWIDILLAGDNAVVIALACRNLPPHLRVWGMVLGAGVAVLLRIFFTLVVASLMTLPYLKIAGGLALTIIAIKLLVPEESTEEMNIHSSERLWHAVRIVALADVVMSLDNVIAIAAAAKGNPVLFMLGLAASVPLIVAGAALFMSLLGRFPILVWAGAGLLGWIAGELIAADPVARGLAGRMVGADALSTVQVIAGLGGIIVVLGVGGYLRRRHLSALARSETS
jgi:YjbE family integral membrane protein